MTKPISLTEEELSQWQRLVDTGVPFDEHVLMTWGHKMIRMSKEQRKKYNDIVFKIKKTYVYMVTFTVDPKKPYNEGIIEELILKQPHRTEFQTQSAYYVKEYTKAGHPHWHMSIVTGKVLRSDAFKYYQNRYGTVDQSRSKYNNQADALLYMSKDSDPIKIV